MGFAWVGVVLPIVFAAAAIRFIVLFATRVCFVLFCFLRSKPARRLPGHRRPDISRGIIRVLVFYHYNTARVYKCHFWVEGSSTHKPVGGSTHTRVGKIHGGEKCENVGAEPEETGGGNVGAEPEETGGGNVGAETEEPGGGNVGAESGRGRMGRGICGSEGVTITGGGGTVIGTGADMGSGGVVAARMSTYTSINDSTKKDRYMQSNLLPIFFIIIFFFFGVVFSLFSLDLCLGLRVFALFFLHA